MLEKGIEKLAFSMEASADGILFICLKKMSIRSILDDFNSLAAQSSISFLDLTFAHSSPVNLGDVSPAR